MSTAHKGNPRLNSTGVIDVYLYQMPATERELVCQILDEEDLWKDLAVNQMGYTKEDLREIKRQMLLGNSPSDELLTMWGNLNHTVTELFILLYRMQQYLAMAAIKDLVDRKYHKLIRTDLPNLSILKISPGEKTSVTKELNQGKMSKNVNEKILNSPENPMSIENNEEQEGTSSVGMDMKDFKDCASTIPQIDYQELVKATNNWCNKNILGKGGFGTVYKGTWKCTAVAIKKIENRGTGTAEANKIQKEQSFTELRHLNSCRHDNILPIYGYSINGDEPCLVYQLMTGGSLEQRLFGGPQEFVLSWSQRVNIAKGTARGLQFLHTFNKIPLIHGDIKPGNILLDPCCQPRIGDFGLAREGPKHEDTAMEVSRVYGTKPYLPAEFLAFRSLSTKVDTYSFGVVLFELMTGLRAYDHRRTHKFLTRHIIEACAKNVSIDNLIDLSCPADDVAKRACMMIIQLGCWCTRDRADERPEMVEVWEDIEKKISL
ncbi:Serine/threonine-protein kinase pelle [Sergentomyia squamirostris]